MPPPTLLAITTLLALTVACAPVPAPNAEAAPDEADPTADDAPPTLTAITAITADGCFEIAAPPEARCAQTATFCKTSSGRYYGSSSTYEVAWAYPADPPEIFKEGVFYERGGLMGPGSGEIPGGLPLREAWARADADADADGAVEVRCEVHSINPCDREAYLSCRGDEVGEHLRQVTLPRDRLLRATWGEGSEELSAVFTIEFAAVEAPPADTAQ